jgi:ribosomal protein S18 acetylase RimI-like enzyme
MVELRFVRATSPAQSQAAAALCIDAFVSLPFPAAYHRPREIAAWADQLLQRTSGAARQELILALGEGPDDALLGCVECGLLPAPPCRPGLPPQPYVANLVVAERARRSGVGGNLVAETEALAASWGFDELYCKVDRANIPARRLYDRLGFRPVFLQTLPTDWTNKQRSNVFMVKALTGRANVSAESEALRGG